MTKNRISNTVTTTVTLDNGHYGNTLTIADAGRVIPASYGAVGVYPSTAGVKLVNHGTVQGGRIFFLASVDRECSDFRLWRRAGVGRKRFFLKQRTKLFI